MCQLVQSGLSSLLKYTQVVQVSISESSGASACCGWNHTTANPLCPRDVRESKCCHMRMQQALHSVACMPRCLQHRLMHMHVRFLYPFNQDLESLSAPQKYSSSEIREKKQLQWALQNISIQPKTSSGFSKYFVAEYLTLSLLLSFPSFTNIGRTFWQL